MFRRTVLQSGRLVCRDSRTLRTAETIQQQALLSHICMFRSLQVILQVIVTISQRCSGELAEILFDLIEYYHDTLRSPVIAGYVKFND